MWLAAVAICAVGPGIAPFCAVDVGCIDAEELETPAAADDDVEE